MVIEETYEAAGIVVASGGRVPEGLEQSPRGRQRSSPATAARHNGTLQTHARRLRLARPALSCKRD